MSDATFEITGLSFQSVDDKKKISSKNYSQIICFKLPHLKDFNWLQYHEDQRPLGVSFLPTPLLPVHTSVDLKHLRFAFCLRSPLGWSWTVISLLTDRMLPCWYSGVVSSRTTNNNQLGVQKGSPGLNLSESRACTCLGSGKGHMTSRQTPHILDTNYLNLYL